MKAREGLRVNGPLSVVSWSRRFAVIAVLLSCSEPLRGAQTVATNVAVAAGGFHSLALKNDGTVWAWGYNYEGELGVLPSTEISWPVLSSNLMAVAKISAGSFHSTVLKSNGTVWAMGHNGDGQIGNGLIGDTTNATPSQVLGLTNVTQISAGSCHNLALSNGVVWGWGFNGDGELGDGTGNNQSTPVKATGLKNVSAVYAGRYHSLAVSNGFVWAWGYNDQGQLGNGGTTDSLVAVLASGVSNVTAVAAGRAHSLALATDGTLWTWGGNSYGQLGTGSTTDSLTPLKVPGLSNVIAVTAGGYQSYALKGDGTVWAWGYNSFDGELGNRTETSSSLPLRVPGISEVASLTARAEYEYGAGTHCLVVRRDGTVWGWGCGSYGQVGDDTEESRLGAVPVDGLTILSPGVPNPLARVARFRRGHVTYAAGDFKSEYYSFVVPLDLQKGVKLSPAGGNVDVLFKTNQWGTVLRHYNGDYPELALQFRNPIAAYGSRVGGSALYSDQSYTFGIYAGTPNNYATDLAIDVFDPVAFTNVASLAVQIPKPSQTNEWRLFLSNGWTFTTNFYGLTTTLRFPEAKVHWNIGTNAAYQLKHKVDESGTNYLFVVKLRGAANGIQMVTNSAGGAEWSPLYTFQFEKKPAWRAVFLDRPHFDGLPLPPEYAGKSAQELNGSLVSPPISISLTNTAALLTLDDSPELRRHPLLDQFVTDMSRDPLALANFVLNEIELTDAIAYQDNGLVDEDSVNLGGVNRGALATYLEGQGSPIEQCALLIYLLRQAGVPATYIFAPHNGVLMLDSQVSKLLGIQIKGAMDPNGNSNIPEMIPLNYPWVAAYISTNGTTTNWVHIFPWMKDHHIWEGWSLNSLMPTNYNSGYKWVRNYLYGDTNILGLSTADTPDVLFPKFIEKALLDNPKTANISLDDIGVQRFNRRNYYSRWTDMPRPLWVTNSGIAVASLTASAITNVSPNMTNLFDTISVTVSSDANPSTKTASGTMRTVDLHNRKFLIRHQTNNPAATHQMILWLAPYSTNTSQVAFGSFDALSNTDSNILKNVVSSVTLGSTDKTLTVEMTHKRHRRLVSQIATNKAFITDAFLGLWSDQEVTAKMKMDKGDLAAICLNYGRVTPKMLSVYAREFWEMEQRVKIDTNYAKTVPSEIYHGTTAYLMGMSFYEKLSRFREVNQQLHKAGEVSLFAEGLARLAARKDGTELPGGIIDLVQPIVDIAAYRVVVAGSGGVHLDRGAGEFSDLLDYALLSIVNGSAHEHAIINSYYKQADAFSTIKLLRLAQKGTNSGGPGIIALDRNNYVSQGTNGFNGKLLKDHDPGMWSEVLNAFQTNGGYFTNYAQVFITPGAITNNATTNKSMGALILGDLFYSALISPALNGGFGAALPNSSYGSDSSTTWRLRLRNDPILKQFAYVMQQEFDAAQTATWANNMSAIWNRFDETIRAKNTWLTPVHQREDQYTLSVFGIGQSSANTDHANAVEAYAKWGSLGWLSTGAEKKGSMAANGVNILTGEFYFDEADLSLPGPMPLEIRRNYSSLNQVDNQFGYGWKMNYMPYLVISTNSTVIFAAEPDGAVVAYLRDGVNDRWYPQPSVNPHIDNHAHRWSATPLRAHIIKEVTNSITYYKVSPLDGSLRVYQVMTFTNSFTNSLDSTRPYLVRWQDNRSNYYTFSYGTNCFQPDYAQVRRVQSSSGPVLNFAYDYYGHMLEAFSGDGRHAYYEYDGAGDLQKVIRPDASEINFEYEHQNMTAVNTNQVTTNSTHLLTKVLRPNGRVLINAYDGERRVTNQMATVGSDLNPVQSASFVYSNNFKVTNDFRTATSGYTVATDARSNPTRYDYLNGLITSVTNALGHAVVLDWFEASETNKVGYYQRSLEKVTDQRRLETSYRYDSGGNVTNLTLKGDLTGAGDTNETAVTSFAYNSSQLLTNVVDPVGNRTGYIYDNKYPYLPAQVIKSAGTSVVSTTFLEYTNVTTTYVAGATNLSDTALGVKRRETRAYGSPDAAVVEWVVDGRGFVTQETKYTGTNDANVVTQFFYNDRGELVEQTDSAGSRTRFDYNGRGQLDGKQVFEANQTTPVSWEISYYNENGELTWSDGPRFGPEDYVYFERDGAGRVSQEIHWRSRGKQDGSGVEAEAEENLYATTFNFYDRSGDLTASVSPRGTLVTNWYDALSQLTNTVVYSSNGTALATNQFLYQPGGEVIRQISPLGGVTTNRYTSTGKAARRGNPDGSTNAWRYLLDGRVQKEIYGNGAYLLNIYDDANRRTTNIFYSAAGTALSTTSSEFDRRGNVVKTIDAAGFVSTKIYDGLDRVKAALGPVVSNEPPPGAPPLPSGSPTTWQEVTVNYYHGAGAVTTNVNALGEKTITWTDALGHPTRVEIRSAAGTVIRETSTSYAANHHSSTTTNGSGASAIVTTSFTDNDGHEVLSIGYPTNGITEYVWSGYDIGGNKISQWHFSRSGSQFSILETNAWTFDALNRPVTQTVRDGATTTFAYDAEGHLTNRVMPGGLTWSASYDSASRRLQEANGSVSATNTSRVRGYSYYPAGNAWAGLPATVTNGVGMVSTNQYDSHLRLSDYLCTNLTVTWRYDARGLLTNVTENANGAVVSVVRSFEAYGHLASESVAAPGGQVSAVMQTWGAAGRRQSFGFGPYGNNFFWRADGLMDSFGGSSGTGSYTYDTGGQLLSRGIGARTTTITARDGMGRILTITNNILNQSGMSEALTWGNGGLLLAHNVTRSGLTDQRNYGYSDFSRRLTQESLNLDSTHRYTNSFEYDSGQAGKAGVLTRAGEPQSGGMIWTAGTDPLLRVANETNTVSRRRAFGYINGPSTVSIYLDDRPMPVSIVGTQWNTSLEVASGSHQLRARAVHPSNLFTNSVTNSFSMSATDRVDVVTDGEGQVTKKIWKDVSGQTNRTQTFTWDARGRMSKVIERDSAQNGFDWLAYYDGFSRKVRTTTTPVTNGVAFSAQPVVIDQYYDPEVEFLEVGVSIGGEQTWKAYGPDLNGVYGGMNGIGGFEAIVPGPHLYCPMINDVQGNALGVYDLRHGGVIYYASRVTGYGAVPGYRPLALGQGATVDSASAWRGKWADVHGGIWLGARYLIPDVGRFASTDPVGHDASDDLYAYGGGNPIINVDFDGRQEAPGFSPPTDSFFDYPGSVHDWIILWDNYYKQQRSDFDAWVEWQRAREARVVNVGAAMDAFVGQVMGRGQQDYLNQQRVNSLAGVYATDPVTSRQQWSMALDVFPPTGVLKGLAEGLTGYNFVSGEYVSAGQQLASAAMAGLIFLPGGGLAGSAERGLSRSAWAEFEGVLSFSGPGNGLGPGAMWRGELFAGRAGRFGDLDALRVTADSLTPHHIPQAALGFTTRADGAAIMLPFYEHLLTRTYGGAGRALARVEADAAFRTVVYRDIQDIRRIAGSRYNDGLLDILRYYRQNFPDLMRKGSTGR